MAAPEECSVDAAEPDDACTEGGERGDKLLIDEAGEHGGDDV